MPDVPRAIRRFFSAVDRLPGGGVPWTPGAKRDYFREKALVSAVITLSKSIDSTRQAAERDQRAGKRSLGPEALGAADAVVEAAAVFDDVDIRLAAASWRQSVRALGSSFAGADRPKHALNHAVGHAGLRWERERSTLLNSYDIGRRLPIGDLPATLEKGAIFDIWIPIAGAEALTGKAGLTVEPDPGDGAVATLTLDGTTRFNLQ